jgi:hypothetical protein
VRVVRDQAIIWNPQFTTPETTVRTGTLLEATARVGMWYEVVAPGADRRLGFIAAAQVELVEGSPPPPVRQTLTAPSTTTARPSASSAPSTFSFRPFFVITGERFSASNTFRTVFGQSFEPMWGGGVELVLPSGVYVDVTASRFSKTGQTAFFFNGQGFGLGIPLEVTLTPVEVSAGYRFTLTSPNVVPYIGGGVGSYGYHEQSSTLGLSGSETSQAEFNARHLGFLAVIGVDVRVSRWISVSGDVQYTRVTGIFGSGGVSEQAGEKDLGGVAVRGRVLVGR